MRKDKILYIAEGFGGGVYTFMVELVNEMVKDYDVTLAYSRRETTPNSIANDFDERIKLVELNNSREINIVKDIKGFFYIRKLIKEENPDIIHLHSSKAGFFGRIANRTIRGSGNREVFYNPHGFSFLQSNVSNLKKKFYWLIEWIASKFGGTIICVSEGEGREAKKLSKNIKVINNSIDVNRVRNSVIDNEDDKSSKNFDIATLARICDQKNPALFNDIASIVDKKFIWIGDGDKRDKLVSNNIEVTGWKDKNKGLKILSNSKIFILTSLWEGLPISLLEAMALGKVCIVTDVIGNNDVIINGENGFIANNKEEFREIINKLENDPDLYSKISDNAYKYVSKKFNIKEMLLSYRRVYNRRIEIRYINPKSAEPINIDLQRERVISN